MLHEVGNEPHVLLDPQGQVGGRGGHGPRQGFGDRDPFAELRHHGVANLVDQAKGLFLHARPANPVHDEGQTDDQDGQQEDEHKRDAKQQAVIPTHRKGFSFVHSGPRKAGERRQYLPPFGRG